VTDSAGVERFAPLFLVSPDQINFQIPPGTARGKARVTITGLGKPVATGSVAIETVAPGLFSADSEGKGLALGFAVRMAANGSQANEPVARYDDERKRYVAVPIDLGTATDKVYLIIIATGVRHRSSLNSVSVRIGGVSAEAFYAGSWGANTGKDQIIALLPRSLAGRGEVDLAVVVDGKEANNLKLEIK
jgi:uncharacterized protein (TIGR03437 family)